MNVVLSSIFNIRHKMLWQNSALSRNHNQRMRIFAKLTLITRRWLYECCHIFNFQYSSQNVVTKFCFEQKSQSKNERKVARLTLITRRWCIHFYMNVVISSIFNSLHKGDKCLHLAEITIKELEESCPTHPNNSKVMHKFLYEFVISSIFNILHKMFWQIFALSRNHNQRMRGKLPDSP